MLSIVRATVLVCTGLALVPALARGQDQTSPGPSTAPASGIGTETRLPALVVSATRSERTLADQPMSVTVVPREQILETPAQALDDVLRSNAFFLHTGWASSSTSSRASRSDPASPA